MKPTKLVIVDTAREDLRAISKWLHREVGKGIAKRQMTRLQKRMAILRRHPLIGERSGPNTEVGIRRLPVGSYVIYYTLRDDQVFVLRVFHGAQNRDPWLLKATDI